MKKQISLFKPGDIQKSAIKIKKKNQKKEESLQLAISKYIKLQYPDAIFNCDLASGMRLPIHIAAKAKAQRSSRGQPDLIILEPKGQYKALCIELKKDYDSVYLKDGKTLKKDKHLDEQHVLLTRLQDKGYYAGFTCGFEHTKKVIDWYFSLQ
jgi:hypothetical protein